MSGFYRKYIAGSFGIFLLGMIFLSCENFMDGKELKEELDKKINYENSTPQNIYFSSSCGKIYPNGMEKYKVSDKINLMFTEDQDYQFIQWQVLDQNNNDITNDGYLLFAEKFKTNTEAVFEKSPVVGVQLKIEPLCASHPKVISWSPSLDSNGAYRDARIAVAFDHNLNENSIYFTEKEIEDLKSKEISEFLSVENSETGIIKTYGYKKDDEIFYKNITITDKETGENLLSKYGIPEFDGGGDTFVLPVNNEDTPLAGTQIIVELKNFFYEYDDDDSVIEENRIIKMGSSHKWHYFVNGNTDSIPPSLPEGYFIETSGIDLDGENRTFSETELNDSNKDFLKKIYLKDEKLHIKASIFDSGSGLALDGFWAEIKKVRDEHYRTVNDTPKKVPLPVKAFSSIATCDTYIDFESEEFADGIYHIDFYAKDKNGNGSTTVLKDGGYVLLDGTAPDAVEGLSATYNSSRQTLSVNWGLPNIDGKTVNDFSHIIFNAKKVASDGTETVIESNKVIKPSDSEIGTNYTLNGIESTEDGTKYIFSVKTVDIFGNTLNEEIVEKTPVTATYLREILLNQYHFSGYSYDNIIATAYFSDMEIDETSEVKMQLYQNDSPYEKPITATIDSESGLASAKFSIPYKTSDEGVIFTVKLLINGVAVKNKDKEEVFARFNVSGRARILSAVLNKESISLAEVKQNKTELTATVTGYNMDLEDKLRMQIINSKNEIVSTKEIFTEEIKWTATSGTNKADLTISDLIPEIDDTYTVKINSGTSSITKTLHIYDVPKFTAFIIPNASVLKSGNEVIASVYGKNFKTPDFNSENLKISGGTIPELLNYKPTITVKDDSFMTITLPVSGISGRHYVNLQMGENSIVGTFNVIAENTTIDYSVGDLILSDGSKISYNAERTAFTEEDFKDDAGNELVPVAVYFGKNENGAPIGVGITNSYAEKFTWASYGTTGVSKMFSEIVGDETTGDMDGSDNWSVICALDPDGTKDPAKNYPAFNYANTYGTRFDLPEDYKDGWYLPSCGELYELFKNENIFVVNKVIRMIPDKYSHLELYNDDYYWTSSQSGEKTMSLFGNSSNGKMYFGDKDDSHYVCAIRAF